jgi:hypothetical protein
VLTEPCEERMHVSELGPPRQVAVIFPIISCKQERKRETRTSFFLVCRILLQKLLLLVVDDLILRHAFFLHMVLLALLPFISQGTF